VARNWRLVSTEQHWKQLLYYRSHDLILIVDGALKLLMMFPHAVLITHKTKPNLKFMCI